jgi:hypothetical protein
MFGVMITTVLRKSTRRPCASVIRPSSQHLQQRVEHVRVCLLDLVEEHHRVRLAPHRLGQLAALLIPDVAGRGADQPAHGVPLLVLAHVEADHVVLAVEQRLGERPGELRFPDTGRPGR